MTLPADYCTRYVVFIDILGFANKIRKINANHAVFEQILNINAVFATAGQEAQRMGDVINAARLDVGWTAFSDTIVVSVPETPQKITALFTLVFGTQRLCQKLLQSGVLARGGLAKGSLYHKDRIVFGSGMIDAYDLEQTVARVPRIAVTPGIAREWGETFGNPQGLAAFKDLIRQDQDGIWFVDLFHFPEGDSLDRETHAFFSRVGGALHPLLTEKSIRLREWSKIAWLANQYNNAKLVQRRTEFLQIRIPDFSGT